MANNNNNETENNSRSSASENEEILRLKKQALSLRIHLKGGKLAWNVHLKCLNSQNKPVVRPWEIIADWTDAWLSIIGEDTTDDNTKYRKSFCSVEVYANKWRKAYSCQQTLQGPECRKFAFNQFADREEMDKVFKPVSLVVVKVTVGIEDDMIDGIDQLEVSNFMNSDFLSDCVIKTEQKDFPCHKVLLAAKSIYFKTMFSNNMKEENENRIDWTTVFDAETVEDLLHFIYTTKMPPNIDNTCFTLIHAAYLCSLKDLQEICGERLETLINHENAVDILLIAKKYEIRSLKEVAVNFIAPQKEEIFKTTAWNDANLEIVREMFSAAMDVVVFQKKLKK